MERGEAPAEYDSVSAGELCELARRRRGRAAELVATAGVPNARGVTGVRGRWNTACLGAGERTPAAERCLAGDAGRFAN